MWAATRAAAKHRSETPGDLAKDLFGANPDIPDDAEVLERGGRYWETYWPLAQEIRRKVVRAQEARERADRKQKAESRESMAPAPVVEAQLSFFDQVAAE